MLRECCPVQALIYPDFLYFNNRNNNKYLKNISRKITYNFDEPCCSILLQGILKQTVEEELKNRVKEKEIIPALLNIKEFCDYRGIRVAVKAACCLKILSEKAWKKNSKCVKLMEIEHTRFSHEFFYWRKTSGKDK